MPVVGHHRADVEGRGVPDQVDLGAGVGGAPPEVSGVFVRREAALSGVDVGAVDERGQGLAPAVREGFEPDRAGRPRYGRGDAGGEAVAGIELEPIPERDARRLDLPRY